MASLQRQWERIIKLQPGGETRPEHKSQQARTPNYLRSSGTGQTHSPITSHEFSLSVLVHSFLLDCIQKLSLTYLYQCHFVGFEFFKDFIYFQREGKGGRKRGRETPISCLSHTSPNWGPSCNPGMCPNRELNPGPFGSQAGAQSTEPHQPGLVEFFKC